MQLAQLCGTTMANVSQQLRLLEAADLVGKKKVRNRERGKPRTLFSLADDYAYVVSLMGNFAGKKLIRLTKNTKQFFRILSIDDAQQRERVEKTYFGIHHYLDKAQALAVDLSSAQAPVILIVTNDKEIYQQLARTVGVIPLSEKKAAEYMKNNDPKKILQLDDPHQIFRTNLG